MLVAHSMEDAILMTGWLIPMHGLQMMDGVSVCPRTTNIGHDLDLPGPNCTQRSLWTGILTALPRKGPLRVRGGSESVETNGRKHHSALYTMTEQKHLKDVSYPESKDNETLIFTTSNGPWSKPRSASIWQLSKRLISSR